MVNLYFAPDAQLTVQDRMVLDALQNDYSRFQKNGVSQVETGEDSDDLAAKQTRYDSASPEDTLEHEQQAIDLMRKLNDPKSPTFDPTVFVSVDTPDIKNPILRKWIIDPYIRWARTIVRVDTDVVMLTHLMLYFTTSVPSALYLFYHFRWWHGLLHFAMQIYYLGPYTLMMHQHIHMRGILSKSLGWLDHSFPYILDPLMGHTWNSYYFHHVKHHHVEANGPDDLSSTVRYQRDDVWNFLHYLGRFYFLIWFDLPRYFLRKRKSGLAVKAGGCEIANYIYLYLLFTKVNARATFCVYLLPLAIMRLGLMIGNWAQHAFVDEVEPESDFRSSITVIDVPSNRYCYNDGYHTSHHLNPLRHWREHPIAFLAQKKQYSDEHALVFYNIDYLMITFNVLSKNYMHLARCLVPMGEQMKMTIEERAELLRTKTRRFTEEEIAEKWGKQYARLK
ncbi:fatty acid desaturas-like protein [Lophiostoma macrostomum CBS 122681]|uniref:Fatty acid desaturas-like protein n=1 Tax=Lophiostoma macrostomum CBS 122681 TaxID=1314788 RepID=A0A6A6TFP5_9PLEO|nr:fatty acid desaturas-like protein [Lophiostoma macrostomum CBS 122681]